MNTTLQRAARLHPHRMHSSQSVQLWRIHTSGSGHSGHQPCWFTSFGSPGMNGSRQHSLTQLLAIAWKCAVVPRSFFGRYSHIHYRKGVDQVTWTRPPRTGPGPRPMRPGRRGVRRGQPKVYRRARISTSSQWACSLSVCIFLYFVFIPACPLTHLALTPIKGTLINPSQMRLNTLLPSLQMSTSLVVQAPTRPWARVSSHHHPSPTLWGGSSTRGPTFPSPSRLSSPPGQPPPSCA